MADIDRKSYVAAHGDKVRISMNNHTEEEKLYDLADLFKVLSDSTRMRILYGLIDKELCVNDLCTILNVEQTAISHQLRILKDAKLVKNRKEGKISLYSLDDDHVKTLISVGMNHVMED